MARNLTCPKCKTLPLKPKKAQNSKIELDVCEQCEGLWFDANELNRLIPVASKGLHPPDDARATLSKCPRCLLALKTFNYPQTYVKIHMCEWCLGLWLYQKEIKEIKAVREHLDQNNDLETKVPPTGVKRTLIRWIDAALESLTTF